MSPGGSRGGGIDIRGRHARPYSSKHVGVPADQFLANFPGDFVDSETFLFRSDLGVHHN